VIDENWLEGTGGTDTAGVDAVQARGNIWLRIASLAGHRIESPCYPLLSEIKSLASDLKAYSLRCPGDYSRTLLSRHPCRMLTRMLNS